ncbi:MAG TPA: outer membrane beta-barrel protein [Candidatus Didemnitutus sp.]|nr:outer membrane beta-barrel protein [Candidatus Didemnitutus sp.]
MATLSQLKVSRLLLLALLFAQQSVFALLNIDGERNQVFVFGSASLTYDSNLLAQRDGESDVGENFALGAEWHRRAGIIAVDATSSITAYRFNQHSALDAVDPNLVVLFSKTSGRLTGSLSLSAYRTQQADSAVNLRTSSWNFPVELSLRYPINEKFYATSDSAAQNRQFEDRNAGLQNYLDFAEGLDGYYVYNSKIDALAGYRVRFGRTDVDRTIDHDFHVGVTGQIFPKVTGVIHVGIQRREIRGTGLGFNETSASAQLTWTATRKLTVVGLVGRDFNTTATSASVDSLSTSLSADYGLNRRFQFGAGISGGRNRFLDETVAGRVDDFFSWYVEGTYNVNEHFKVVSRYTYFDNQSDEFLAEFDRNQFSITLSGRY